MKKIAIVGAGHAGGRTAQWLRQLGFEGDIDLFGEEPWLPYERPPLSKGFLEGSKKLSDFTLFPDSFFEDQRIYLHLSMPVTDLDLHSRVLHLGGRRRVNFDYVVMATGGGPRELPVEGANLEGCYYLRSLADSENLAEAFARGGPVVIIGGGFIGLEVAATARSLGLEVTVVEAASRLLARACPREVSDDLQRLHEDQGVKFVFDAAIDRLEGEKTLTALRLKGGQRIEGRTVVIGIGLQVRDDLAKANGLDCRNGVVVESNCLHSTAALGAIGDVACAEHQRYGKRVRLESWQNAEQQAEIVARSLLGQEVSWNSVPWFWSDQFGWNLQMTGLPEEDSQIVRRGRLEDGKVLTFMLKDGQLVAGTGLGLGMKAAKDLRLIQMLIEKSARPATDLLEDQNVSLKSLLKATA